MLRDLVHQLAERLRANPRSPSPIAADEEVLFFPTFATVSESGDLALRVQGWVGRPERHSRKRSALLKALSTALGLHDPGRFADDATEIFLERARPFLADNKRGKRIGLRVGHFLWILPRSSASGHFVAELLVPADAVRPISPSPASPEPASPEPASSTPRSLQFSAVLGERDPRTFTGAASILTDGGVSVVTDIDDTIKISDVRDTRRLLRRTFTEPLAPAKGMPEFITRLASVPGGSIHYVSASPWQLLPCLHRFLIDHGFPTGSLHLRSIRLKDRSLFELFREPTSHKTSILRKLIQRLPKRRFILVGDSSEQDPEIYAAIAREHPSRIDHVYIRDTTGEGMTSARYKRSLWPAMDERWTLFVDPAHLPLPPRPHGA